jgi:hypothetical protein
VNPTRGPKYILSASDVLWKNMPLSAKLSVQLSRPPELEYDIAPSARSAAEFEMGKYSPGPFSPITSAL